MATVGKPFVKGRSGNPKGRPKGTPSIPDILRRIGAEPAGVNNETKLDLVMRKVYAEAVKGRQWAVEFIATRTEGKPRDSMDMNLTGQMTHAAPALEQTLRDYTDAIKAANARLA